ncbi:MAG: hypothetical protein ABIG28_01710, partial [archaeon]
MCKKKRQLIIFNSAIFQIVLLIGMSFAVAFILEERIVSAGPLSIGYGDNPSTFFSNNIYGGEGIFSSAEISNLPSLIDASATGSQEFVAYQSARAKIAALEEGGAASAEEIAGLKEKPAAFENPGETATKPGFLSNLFKGKIFGSTTGTAGVGGALVSGAVWGGIVYFGVSMVTNLLGLDEGLSNALSLGAG